MTTEEKQQQLREEWRKYPERRKTIELRAKLLKLKGAPPLEEPKDTKEIEDVFLK